MVGGSYDSSSGTTGDTEKTNLDREVAILQLGLYVGQGSQTVGDLLISTPVPGIIAGQKTTLAVGAEIKGEDVKSGLEKRQTITAAAIHIGTVLVAKDDYTPSFTIQEMAVSTIFR